MLGLEQQADFRAAEDDRLGTTGLEPVDHVLVQPPRALADNAHAQLLIDDAVHRLALRCIGHQHLQALVFQAAFEERLLHGEGCAQQPHAQGAGCLGGLHHGVGNMHKGHSNGGLYLPGDLVHGVGAEHHAFGAAGFQAPGCLHQDRRRVVPAPGMLGLFDRPEVDAVH